MPQSALLTIGELSRRTGMSVSAIRFYEARGLVQAIRTQGNQRRFLRSDIRRLSFALIAQQLGLTLTEIEAELGKLPQGRTPTRADWEAISLRIREALENPHARANARFARRMYRLRMSVAGELPALQSGRPRRASGRGAAFRVGRSAGGDRGRGLVHALA
jgi:redox-sensitive transcriptional activator SoxR